MTAQENAIYSFDVTCSLNDILFSQYLLTPCYLQLFSSKLLTSRTIFDRFPHTESGWRFPWTGAFCIVITTLHLALLAGGPDKKNDEKLCVTLSAATTGAFFWMILTILTTTSIFHPAGRLCFFRQTFSLHTRSHQTSSHMPLKCATRVLMFGVFVIFTEIFLSTIAGRINTKQRFRHWLASLFPLSSNTN